MFVHNGYVNQVCTIPTNVCENIYTNGICRLPSILLERGSVAFSRFLKRSLSQEFNYFSPLLIYLQNIVNLYLYKRVNSAIDVKLFSMLFSDSYAPNKSFRREKIDHPNSSNYYSQYVSEFNL